MRHMVADLECQGREQNTWKKTANLVPVYECKLRMKWQQFMKKQGDIEKLNVEDHVYMSLKVIIFYVVASNAFNNHIY